MRITRVLCLEATKQLFVVLFSFRRDTERANRANLSITFSGKKENIYLILVHHLQQQRKTRKNIMAKLFRSAFKSLFKPFDPSRRCVPGNYYIIDDPNQSQLLPNVDFEASCCVAGETKLPVTVEDFPRHVSHLHADGDIGFSKEYELIQNECIVDEHSSEHSQHSDNKSKNRYLNIIACKFQLCF